jgi:hypothetical protein
MHFQADSLLLCRGILSGDANQDYRIQQSHCLKRNREIKTFQNKHKLYYFITTKPEFSRYLKKSYTVMRKKVSQIQETGKNEVHDRNT